MSYPSKIKTRGKIEALTGIKSSLDRIKSVVALLYLIYIANNRKSYVKYSIADGSTIKMAPDLQKAIEGFLDKGDLDDIINTNPLFVNQYEPLYVGVTLLLKFGYINMEGKSNTAERTGGNRYPKQLSFANNILVLDLILQGFSDIDLKDALYEWLRNNNSTNIDFEDRVCKFLTTCMVFTQFKLRDNENNEIYFQTEGIYETLIHSGEDVIFTDNHELVGPSRIYKNILKEGLEPWVSIDKNNILSKKLRVTPDVENIHNMITTTLNIYNVKDDSNDKVETVEYTAKDTNHLSLQQIFYGAPGTGKTRCMQKDYYDKYPDTNRLFTTFHQSYSYEDFIEGLKPILGEKMSSKDVEQEGDVKYKIEKGVFYQACERAAVLAGYDNLQACIDDSKEGRFSRFEEAKQNGNIMLLCIDEINRGNIAAIFGDLISLIEPSKRLGAGEYEMIVSLPYSKDKFGVPANLFVLGTMNTADRSIQLLDSALRRRFEFREFLPNYDAIKNEDARGILESINARIRGLLNKDNQIGHSYFVDAKTSLDIVKAIVKKIIPLLEEYFYNDIEKVRFVLNDTKATDNCFYVEDKEASDAYASYQSNADINDESKTFYKLNDGLQDAIDTNDEEKCKAFLQNLLEK